jgi:hypothetical protein
LDHHLEFWEPMGVECTGKPDEATLQLLRVDHRATANVRKRKRGKKEEPLPRPVKMLRRQRGSLRAPRVLLAPPNASSWEPPNKTVPRLTFKWRFGWTIFVLGGATSVFEFFRLFLSRF